MHNNPACKLKEQKYPLSLSINFLELYLIENCFLFLAWNTWNWNATKHSNLFEWWPIKNKEPTCKSYCRLQVHLQLDYDNFVYRSARRSYLKELDPMQNESLRLVWGAFKTSPVESLYTEALEASLLLRSKKLKSCPSNPAHDCTFKPRYKQYFAKKKKC